ncbi:MAG: HAD family phosphatase [Archangiaceae bacterium]|nr:HAD family phosphatase [Archangiaceae bacterium]
MPITAVLFDLDGTLVDNMHIHVDEWVKQAEAHRSGATREQIGHQWAGKKNEELIPLMLGREATAAELRDIAHAKETGYRARAESELAEVPGTTALLERLRAAGLKLAVATAAPAENRRLALDGRLKLGRFFDVVVGPEGAVRGKPSPDIFLACTKALEVAPRDCIVFEDAVNGVKAGLAAGARVAAVTTTHDEATLRAIGASWVMRDYLHVPEELEQLLVRSARGA